MNPNTSQIDREIAQILATAQQLAHTKKSSSVCETDILIALLENPNPIIAEILTELNTSKNQLIEELRSEFKSPLFHNIFAGNGSPQELPYDPVIKLFFDRSREIAQNFQENNFRIPHLLMAFAELQNQSAMIAKIFQKHAISASLIHDAYQKIILHHGSSTPFLAKFTTDLTASARNQKLDPIIGREHEIEELMNILTRRRKNNPVIFGDAGVGKTALVEGLSQRISAGQVPLKLKNKRLLELSLNSLLAGATKRGEYEERLQKVITEIEASNGSIILFIDEIHSLVKNENNQDAINILKPALSRSQIQIIGATTTAEYHRYFEKDPAFERRFQPLFVDQSSEADCLKILEGLKSQYEEFHELAIPQELLPEIIKLSQQYIANRSLPDKALDLLDSACVLCKNCPPIPQANSALKILDQNSIKLALARISNLELSFLNQDHNQKIINCAVFLKSHIIGQDPAIDTVTAALFRNISGFKKPNRPIGSFIFLGPTGTGKTELAETLAQYLFGTKDALTRFDMSEFAEKHSAAKLIGAPPGYIGYEEGGQLTEKIRVRPYSIILFDEIEKAHADIFDLLLQMLDEGHLSDNQGHRVNFKNTLIICTSNIGQNSINPETLAPLQKPEQKKILITELQKFLRIELINRFDDLIYFQPLSLESLLQITDLLLEETITALKEQGFSFSITAPAKKALVELGFEPTLGARPLRYVIQQEIETPLSQLIATQKIPTGSHITADLQNQKIAFQFGQ